MPLCSANRMTTSSSLTLIIDAEHSAPINETIEEIPNAWSPNKETDSLVSKNTAKEKDFLPVLRRPGKENQDIRFWSILCFTLHQVWNFWNWNWNQDTSNSTQALHLFPDHTAGGHNHCCCQSCLAGGHHLFFLSQFRIGERLTTSAVQLSANSAV